VSGGREEDTGEEFDRRWGGRGEEVNEAVAMSSISGRDELDESGVEELGDEDHDGEDEDGGEELDKAAAMTSTVDRDEFDEVRGRACGMARSNGWIHDGVGKLLKAASVCGRDSVGLGVEPALICVSALGRCWRWS
jgi:hypothetical protein